MQPSVNDLILRSLKVSNNSAILFDTFSVGRFGIKFLWLRSFHSLTIGGEAVLLVAVSDKKPKFRITNS